MELAQPGLRQLGTALLIVRRLRVIHGVVEPDCEFHRQRLNGQMPDTVEFDQTISDVDNVVVVTIWFLNTGLSDDRKIRLARRPPQPRARVATTALESARSLVEIQQSAIHRIRNVFAHNLPPACRANQTLNHAGTDFAEDARWDEEDRADIFVQISVNISHRPLEFIVTRRADSTQDMRVAPTDWA